MYRQQLKELLGSHCVDTLKRAVDTNELTKDDCLELARQISEPLHGYVVRYLERRSDQYDIWTIDELLNEWYRTCEDPEKDVCVKRIVDILESSNINNRALARKLNSSVPEIHSKVNEVEMTEIRRPRSASISSYQSQRSLISLIKYFDGDPPQFKICLLYTSPSPRDS